MHLKWSVVVLGHEYWTRQKCLMPFATMTRTVKYQLWNWLVIMCNLLNQKGISLCFFFFIIMLLFHNFDHSQFIVCNIDRWRECIYTSLSCLGSMRGSVWFNLVTSTNTSQCCWICSAAYFVHLFISAPAFQPGGTYCSNYLGKPLWVMRTLEFVLSLKRDHKGMMTLDYEVKEMNLEKA